MQNYCTGDICHADILLTAAACRVEVVRKEEVDEDPCRGGGEARAEESAELEADVDEGSQQQATAEGPPLSPQAGPTSPPLVSVKTPIHHRFLNCHCTITLLGTSFHICVLAAWELTFNNFTFFLIASSRQRDSGQQQPPQEGNIGQEGHQPLLAGIWSLENRCLGMREFSLLKYFSVTHFHSLSSLTFYLTAASFPPCSTDHPEQVKGHKEKAKKTR